MKLPHPVASGLAVAASSLAVGAAPAAAQTTIYVAPSGSDSAAGTASAPVRTLTAALGRAGGGERVHLAAGSYGYGHDERARAVDVDVVGAGIGATKVNGLEIFGGQHLRFSAMTFTGAVRLQGHPVKHAAQPASAVIVTASELTNPTNLCLSIREGAREIAITANRIHDCTSGIVGQGNPYVSRGITIERNTVERITADAIQFGAWSDVRIARNTIRDIADPAGVIHNDGIQLTGNSTGVEISRNRISNARSQLVFIQDAIGPIDDVEVTANLLLKAGAVALQSQGATHAVIRSNTIWGGKDGGLWLTKGYVRNGVSVVPTDTVAMNNLTTTMRVMDGAAVPGAAGNVVLCPGKYSGQTVPAGAGCVADPLFADVAAGRYWLSSTSRTRALGTPAWLPAGDINGDPFSAPVPGAYR